MKNATRKLHIDGFVKIEFRIIFILLQELKLSKQVSWYYIHFSMTQGTNIYALWNFFQIMPLHVAWDFHIRFLKCFKSRANNILQWKYFKCQWLKLGDVGPR